MFAFFLGIMKVDSSGPLSVFLSCKRRIRRLIKIPDRSAKAPVNSPREVFRSLPSPQRLPVPP
jgi:hypothetical protein